MLHLKSIIAVLAALTISTALHAAALGTAFTYQGQLVLSETNVTDTCDFNFGLWDAVAGGGEVTTAVDVPNVNVNEGVFTVELDFNSGVFSGDASWLEIAVVCPAGGGGLTTLSPRQEVSPTPNALFAVEAGGLALNVRDPEIVGSLGIGTDPRSMYVSGRYAYVVDVGSDDLKVIDVSDPSAPSQAGSFGIGTNPTSVYVSGRYAYVTDSQSDDLKVIDVSDPGTPTLAGSLGIGTNPTSVHVSGRYAYVVDSNSYDLKVIDVSDPSTPSLAGSLGIGTFPQSVYVSGRYAYVVDAGSGDLKVIDVSDPSAPSLAGSLGIGTFPTSVYVSGRYAYVAEAGSGDLKVIDVSDPSAPSLAGSLGIGANPNSVYVSGRYAYVVDSDSDDLKVIDVSDPSTPSLAGSLVIGAQPNSVYVSGRYAYVVDWGADDLKVIDVSGAELPSLIAHSLEAGNLQVRNDIIAQGQLQVTGGLTAGSGGIFSAGDVGVSGSITAEGKMHIQQSADSDSDGLVLSNTGAGRALRLWVDGSNNSRIDSGLAGNQKLVLNGGAGRVAIGTTDSGNGRLTVLQSSDTSANGMTVLNSGFNRGVRLWVDSNMVSRLESGATGAGDMSLNGSGAGNIGLGMTNPSVRLDVNGSIEYTGTIADVSDDRLKQDLLPVEDALAKVQSLDGYSYSMSYSPGQREVGLLAQQVQAVLPEAVSIVDPQLGHLGVSYPSLIPLLIEAIKEQQLEITQKTDLIGSLEQRVAALEQTIFNRHRSAVQ